MRRTDRLRQGQPRQADVRLGRAGRAASSVHGNVQEHDRHEGDVRAVPRQPAGAQRRGRRSRPDDVLRPRSGHRRDRRPARSARSAFRRRSALPEFPDIPPIAEAGVPGFDAVSWQMFVAPAKTPRPIVDQLNRELTEILAEPGHQGADHSSSAFCRSPTARSTICKPS